MNSWAEGLRQAMTVLAWWLIDYCRPDKYYSWRGLSQGAFPVDQMQMLKFTTHDLSLQGFKGWHYSWRASVARVNSWTIISALEVDVLLTLRTRWSSVCVPSYHWKLPSGPSFALSNKGCAYNSQMTFEPVLQPRRVTMWPRICSVFIQLILFERRNDLQHHIAQCVDPCQSSKKNQILPFERHYGTLH